MIKLIAVLVAAVLITADSVAGCDRLYPNQQPITIADTTELCSSFFVVLYDVDNKAVVLASEIVGANHHSNVQRHDSFRADVRIPAPHRVEPSDYIRSGYDKGHVVPAGDATTLQEMADTFLMTNMTPQDPALNRKAWRKLEAMIRARARQDGKDTVVLTIVAYPDRPKTIGIGIPVPNAYYKIVYFVTGTRVYYATNTPNAGVVELPVSLIKQTPESPIAVYLP